MSWRAFFFKETVNLRVFGKMSRIVDFAAKPQKKPLAPKPPSSFNVLRTALHGIPRAWLLFRPCPTASFQRFALECIPGRFASAFRRCMAETKTKPESPRRPELSLMGRFDLGVLSWLGFNFCRFSSESFDHRLDSGYKASYARNNGVGWPTL